MPVSRWSACGACGGSGGAAVGSSSRRWTRAPTSVLFAGVTLVSIGSAYYHWDPNNQTLFWDRLAMTVAFMALFSALVADRVRPHICHSLADADPAGAGRRQPDHRTITEGMGQGDLRLYGLVQFYPMLAVPVMVWLFRPARYTDSRYVFAVIAWYALSKLLEHYDAAVFDALGGAVSGHSLKHLAAAVATFMVLRMLATVAERVRDDVAPGICRHGRMMVRAAGLEPARAEGPTDFKSVASTNSATPAGWPAKVAAASAGGKRTRRRRPFPAATPAPGARPDVPGRLCAW